jgi:hypothetical protein
MANYWSEQIFHQVFKNYINTHLHVSASTGHHQKFLQHYREILYMYAIHKYLCVRIFSINNKDLDIIWLHRVCC